LLNLFVILHLLSSRVYTIVEDTDVGLWRLSGDTW